MHIQRITTRNFRNLGPLDLDVSPGFVVVRGPNAQGKTNLLEALYVCATGKSFRTTTSREMIRHGEEGGRLEALFARQGVRHHIEVVLNDRRRTIRVDNKGLKRTSQLLELVNVVAFFPDDLRIIKGSPEERRRFLDRAVANYRSELVDATAAYEKALKSRNKVLKDHDSPPRHLIEIYDEQLVAHGSVIQRCRTDVLELLQPRAEALFAELMGSGVRMGLSLDGGLDAETGDEDFAADFARALRASFPRDRARRSTSVGPHRGDLIVVLDGTSARSFASQGQQRAMVLALKLAEVEILAEQLASPPILLLDDVSSELDTRRTEHLFRAVEGLHTQVWISTTGAAELPFPADAQLLEMHQGSLQNTASSVAEPA